MCVCVCVCVCVCGCANFFANMIQDGKDYFKDMCEKTFALHFSWGGLKLPSTNFKWTSRNKQAQIFQFW